MRKHMITLGVVTLAVVVLTGCGQSAQPQSDPTETVPASESTTPTASETSPTPSETQSAEPTETATGELTPAIDDIAFHPVSEGGGEPVPSTDEPVIGILQRDGGCTYVELPEQSITLDDCEPVERVVPVFPFGSAHWLGEELVSTGVELDPATAHVGDTVTFGGSLVRGSVDLPELTIPSGCGELVNWAVSGVAGIR